MRSVSRWFDGYPASVSQARHFCRDTLAVWGMRESWMVQQAATEMVTNAVVHAGTPFTITLGVTQTRVRIRVEDASQTHPYPRPLNPLSTAGRGLHILDALVAAWGVRPSARGKIVWADLPRPATTSAGSVGR